MTIRRIHLLLGVLFAPTLVFVAVTGAIMLLELQKRSEDRDPAKWIVHVTEVHKHQKWEPKQRAAAPAGGASATAPRPAEPTPPPSIGTRVLKGFLVAMATSLVISTVLGVHMAWRVPQNRALVAGLLAAGALIPAACLLF